MGRVAYFTVGGCQVLKPCRGLVSFCFMYLVLCTKSENKTNKIILKYLGFHIVVFVVSVASATVTAAERSAFRDTFLLYLSYESLSVVSINKMLSCHPISCCICCRR